MITIITGKPGAGKSYYMTFKAWELIKQGHDIYANWHIDFHHLAKKLPPEKQEKMGRVFYWSEVAEIIHVKGGQIFIDEAHAFFDSREWQEMPPAARQKFSAHRHEVRINEDGKVVPTDIWAAVQSASNIDKRIRQLGQYYINMKHLGRLYFVNYFELGQLMSDESSQPPKSLYTRFHWFRKRVANCYDTHANVNYIPVDEFPFIRKYTERWSNKNSGLSPTGEISYTDWRRKQRGR